MAGILDMGTSYRKRAIEGLSQATQLESQREAANRQLQAQASAANASMIGSFIGLAISMF